jgi:hypothetical protein
MEMADLVKNPVSFVGVRRSKFGRKGRSAVAFFGERAICFMKKTSSVAESVAKLNFELRTPS